MRRLLPAAALLLAAAAAAEEPDVSEEVRQTVGAYITSDDESRLAGWEALLQKTPLPVLERAIRESPRADQRAIPGSREFELTVPETREAAKVFVYLPEGYDTTRTWPAVLSMHGTCSTGGGADERGRWMRKVRGDDQFVVIAPEERPSLWGKGWGSTTAERALNLAALDHALRHWRIDPDRVFLAGVSRGGHATWELGLLNADRFAGLYANAGGPRLINFGYLDNLGRLPLLEVLGGKDQPQLVDNVRAAVKQMKEAGGEVDFREYADKDHGVGYDDDRAFVEWMMKRRRDGAPKQVVHAFAGTAHARAHWLEASKVSGVLDPSKSPPAVNIPPGTKPTDAEIREMYRKKIAEGVARMEARVEGNRIDITARKVREVIVYLSDRLVNLDQPVEVWINGKKIHSGIVARDGMKMLRHVRATGDRGRLYVNWLKLAVP